MKQIQNKEITVLFIGDVFAQPGIDVISKQIPLLKQRHNIDCVIAQSENVSERKGLTVNDYQTMKSIGVDIFTLGNHVWAKSDILNIINQDDIVRPANIPIGYPGQGSVIFKTKKNYSLRVTSLMGISFNKLLTPWKEEYALNFFDTIDNILEYERKTDFHFIDFHAETTSEKYVLGLYLDGKVDGVCGTHTHVQTNDAHLLPNKTCYITDAGSCGPYDSAIGANFLEVYKKMRYEEFAKFKVSNNLPQFNGVLMTFNTINKENNKILAIKILP